MTTWLNIAATLLACLVVIVSIRQVGLLKHQVNQEREVNAAQLYFEVQRIFAEIDRIFLDNPELRPFFYSGRAFPQQDSMLAIRVTVTAELIFDLAESAVVFFPRLGPHACDYAPYFQHLFRNSEALRRYWADCGHYYPTAVAEAFGTSPGLKNLLTPGIAES